MPGMHRVPHVDDMFSFVDVGVALVAHEATSLRFLLGIASLTEGTAGVLHKTGIGKTGVTDLTYEAVCVPAAVHGLDDTTDDVLATLPTTRCVQLLEIVLAVLPTVKLVEGTLVEWPEALSTDETCFVVELTVGVDHLLLTPEHFVAHIATRRRHRHPVRFGHGGSYGGRGGTWPATRRVIKVAALVAAANSPCVVCFMTDFC